MKKIVFSLLSLLLLFTFGCKTVDYDDLFAKVLDSIVIPEETSTNLEFVKEINCDGKSVSIEYFPATSEISSDGVITLVDTDTEVLISVVLSYNGVKRSYELGSVIVKASESYTISYNLAGGICAECDQVTSFKYGETVTLPTPKKQGFNFIGWYENNEKIETITNKNYKLLAKWEQVNFVITYDLDGGTSEDLILSFNKDEKVNLPIPVKEHFEFIGWYENNVKVNTITNKDYELVARWQASTNIYIEKDVDECFVGSDAMFSLVGVAKNELSLYSWSVSDESIVTIDNDSIGYFSKAGTVTINAVLKSDNSICASLELDVKNPKPNLKLSTEYVYVGTPFSIQVDNYSPDTNFRIHIDNTDIVQYDGTNFKGLCEGEVTIKFILASDQQTYQEIKVLVYSAAPIINLETKVLKVGNSVRLDVANYDESEFNIFTSDTGIISINGRVIVALNQGSALVTVSLKSNPNISSNVTIEVNPTTPFLELSTSNILVGGKARLMIKNLRHLESQNISDYIINCSSFMVATIDNDYIVTGVSEGTAIITVTLKTNSRVTSSINVIVSKTSDVKDSLGEINSGLLFLSMDDPKCYIKAGDIDYLHIDKAIETENYVWLSTNTDVCQVYDNGRITAVASGYAAIHVWNKNNPQVKGIINIEVYGVANVDYVSRMIKIAENEIGYQEIGENGTKFGTWYGLPGEAWCAMFVSWCAYQAGISTNVIPKYCGCTAGSQWFISHDQFGYKGEYTPKAGDIIFFLSDGASHTGIVINCIGNTVYTIEGNTSDMVAKRNYSLNYSKITGYGIPKYPQYTGTVEGGGTDGSSDGSGEKTS